jgi:hypothetical protein
MEIEYNPNGLLDEVIRKCQLKNDAALARQLGVPPPVISKTRHNKLIIGSSLILKIHEMCDMPVREIRSFVGGNP